MIYRLGDAAFCACENLETINFPKSLLYIGKDAFFACKKLNRIDLPNNLTTISENAFGSCINIQDLHIPKRLHQLSSDSFHGCTKLETITLDDESEVFDLYDGCLYDILMKKLYIVPGTKKSVTFPDGIKEIGRAFSGNDLIETILLPDSIESIENGAFSGCVRDIYRYCHFAYFMVFRFKSRNHFHIYRNGTYHRNHYGDYQLLYIGLITH